MATYDDTLLVYNSGKIKKIASGDTVQLDNLTVDSVLTLGSTDVTSTAAEINKLDGVTATTAEINYLAGVTLGTSSASKVVTADSSGNVILAGNLTVSGATTTVSSTNTIVADQLLELGNGRTGSASGDAGIIIERGDDANAIIAWDESADIFVLGTTTATGASSGDLTITAAGLSVSALTLGGTAITSTAAEINHLDGSSANLATFALPASTTISAFGATLVDDANAATARATLGLVIGTNVQAYDAQLADIAGLTPTDGNIIVGDGTNFVTESGATARSSLGLAIGSDVQAYDAELAAIAGLTSASNKLVRFTGSGTADLLDFSTSTSLGTSSTTISSQNAVKSYVDSQIGSGGAANALDATSLQHSEPSALTAGTIIALSGSEIIAADAANGGENVVIGVATDSLASSTNIGNNVHSAWGKLVTVKLNSETIAAGATIYLSATSGYATKTLPSGSGQSIYRLGYVVDSDADDSTSLSEVDIIWMPQFIAEL